MLKISFIGYLGEDCRTRYVNDQVAITFSVGVSNQYKNRQGETIRNTTWVGCTLWRKPENLRITEFLKKGLQVYVEGEPSTRAWIKQADGTANCSLDCRVDFLEMTGKQPGAKPTESQAPAASATPAQGTTNNNTGYIDENDDLPF